MSDQSAFHFFAPRNPDAANAGAVSAQNVGIQGVAHHDGIGQIDLHPLGGPAKNGGVRFADAFTGRDQDSREIGAQMMIVDQIVDIPGAGSVRDQSQAVIMLDQPVEQIVGIFLDQPQAFGEAVHSFHTLEVNGVRIAVLTCVSKNRAQDIDDWPFQIVLAALGKILMDAFFEFSSKILAVEFTSCLDQFISQDQVGGKGLLEKIAGEVY